MSKSKIETTEGVISTAVEPHWKPQLTRFAPWLGSKATLAKKIIQHLGTPSSYWEPFCGSAAVYQCLKMYYPDLKHAHLNDQHEELTNFLLVLADEKSCEKLKDRVSRTFFCENIFKISRTLVLTGQHLNKGNVDRAYHWFMYVWIGCNGVAGTKDNRATGYFPIRYKHDGGDPKLRFWNATKSIPIWHEMLQDVTITNRDGFEILQNLLEKNDADDVSIYLDPPYILEGDQYKHGWEADNSGLDLFGDSAKDKHEDLAELVNKFRHARIVVSYIDHPRLVEMYPPDRWIKYSHTMNRHLSNFSQPDLADEVLLVRKRKDSNAI